MSRSETTDSQLFDLGIYVQDYELHIAKQLSEILPVLKSMPRIASSLCEVSDEPVAYPVLAAS
jgi:hypothetical protein